MLPFYQLCFLRQVVHKRLMAVLRHLIPGSRGHTSGGGAMWFPARDISTESLIVGALEAAFWEMVNDRFQLKPGSML
jgi:hypothetical protein